MSTLLITNATIINEGNSFKGSVLINNKYIENIFIAEDALPAADFVIDAANQYLIPGVIDDQVHFREPGLTHKGDMATESRAAVAGGVTSFMEMPNTNPQTTTIADLEKKIDTASRYSPANYSFYIGATNQNLRELLNVDASKVCGIKVFMGSSTGNMLVDNSQTLNDIFKETKMLIATHCEDENIIKANTEHFRSQYGEAIPFLYHPLIRNEEACYRSASIAVELALKHNSRLHLLHLSTAREMLLLSNNVPLEDKQITGEVCVHHLWFDDSFYNLLGSRIKWNPAIKTSGDREALRNALINNRLDVVATDHAPHTLAEKQQSYFKAPSGGPLIQHSLCAMLEMTNNGVFTKEMVIEKMCHAPAKLFRIAKRGFIRKGYYADLVLVHPNLPETVEDESVLYKCKWSPFAGTSFTNKITHTFVNGHPVYINGAFNFKAGMALEFDV
ncbi:MAG: dihydroorotase [Cytophagaceae bacterium]|jgi:dihydroorotase|nr:dihydroorotase [Cytophagaceae bacterium]